MTTADIRALLPVGCPLFFGTDQYVRPTLAWLQGDFYAYFQQQLFDFSVGKWTVDWECRDFADAYRVFAQIALADTPGKQPDQNAIAVGVFWFKPDPSRGMPPGEGHAVNIVLTESPSPLFIDSQTGVLWQMSVSEILSCYFARF